MSDNESDVEDVDEEQLREEVKQFLEKERASLRSGTMSTDDEDYDYDSEEDETENDEDDMIMNYGMADESDDKANKKKEKEKNAKKGKSSMREDSGCQIEQPSAIEKDSKKQDQKKEKYNGEKAKKAKRTIAECYVNENGPVACDSKNPPSKDALLNSNAVASVDAHIVSKEKAPEKSGKARELMVDKKRRLASPEQEDIGEKYRRENRIIIEPAEDANAFKPLVSFSALKSFIKLPSGISSYLEQFKSPSAIQSQAWPILLAGRDMVGIAETGSGKTLAFGLPVVMQVHSFLEKSSDEKALRIADRRGVCEPMILVIAPTRELAKQTNDTFMQMLDFLYNNDTKSRACFAKAKSVCLFGGENRSHQLREMKMSGKSSLGIVVPLIVVGTPGRLLDFVHSGDLQLSKVSFIILDEADRMLDLGFEKDIRDIVSATSKEDTRQTCMFSATWPVSIRKLANEFLTSPLQVTIARSDIASSGSTSKEASMDSRNEQPSSLSDMSSSMSNRWLASSTVRQVVEVLQDPFARDALLVGLLKQYQNKQRSNRILIFVLYKKEADRVEAYLKRHAFSSMATIHGDKSQASRFEALNSFKSGACPLLIATDVAARGLDIPDVEVVINFTFPLTIEDYIHRIGRTGRAGKAGLSHTLFTPNEKHLAGELIQVLKTNGQVVPDELLKFGSTIKKKEHKDYGAFYKNVDLAQKGTHKTFAED